MHFVRWVRQMKWSVHLQTNLHLIYSHSNFPILVSQKDNKDHSHYISKPASSASKHFPLVSLFPQFVDHILVATINTIPTWERTQFAKVPFRFASIAAR